MKSQDASAGRRMMVVEEVSDQARKIDGATSRSESQSLTRARLMDVLTQILREELPHTHSGFLGRRWRKYTLMRFWRRQLRIYLAQTDTQTTDTSETSPDNLPVVPHTTRWEKSSTILPPHWTSRRRGQDLAPTLQPILLAPVWAVLSWETVSKVLSQKTCASGKHRSLSRHLQTTTRSRMDWTKTSIRNASSLDRLYSVRTKRPTSTSTGNLNKRKMPQAPARTQLSQILAAHSEFTTNQKTT